MMTSNFIRRNELQNYLSIVKQDLSVASVLFEQELDEIRQGVIHMYSNARNAPPPSIETTELYNMIRKGTRGALREAWRKVPSLTVAEINIRSTSDKSSYLHVLINMIPTIYDTQGDLKLVVPLIYRLALQGIRANALNDHGNTVLHLACLRPKAQELCIHLLRIGCDPSILNEKNMRVIHTYRNNKFTLVKGQKSIKSGIWNAVKSEDLEMTEKLLRTWCRVEVEKNKGLTEVAEATSNEKLTRLLEKYRLQNEFVCATLACDVNYMKDLYTSTKIDVNIMDYAHDVPKPLLLSVEEMPGKLGLATERFLLEKGANPTSEYFDRLTVYQSSFEESQLFKLIEAGDTSSILEGLDLITAGKVDLSLRSHASIRKGWTYLHFIVYKYLKMKEEEEEKCRLLVRAMYRLAIAGIDVHARDDDSATALCLASTSEDQQLIRHLLRIGCDSSILDRKGRTVTTYIYEDRGKLVFDKTFRHDELPGLWVGVDRNDMDRTERWLRSWSRVKVKRGDRYMLDIVRAQGHKELAERLKAFELINEFVCATFACDLNYMKYIIAMGKGDKKTNTLDEFFHVGYTWDRHAEFMPRPVIITAMELCTPEVVNFLLKFGADLSRPYEEEAPCGPVAFWAFREHVNNDNLVVVCQYADPELKDELGCTLLHRTIQKPRSDRKTEIVQILLDRGIDISSRDWEGSTARDYINIYGPEDGPILRQTIDDYVLNLVNEEQYNKLETLLLDGYDHVLDITGIRRKHVVNARAIAVIKEYKEIIELLDDWKDYRKTIERLHNAAKEGSDLVYRISGEKKCSFSKDKAGRSLLHQAALFEHREMAAFLVEQYPHLINTRDNLDRIPLNLCVCTKTRHEIWPILQDGGADPNLAEVNNYSNYDYVRELETPTPVKDKPRGRRWRDYRPQYVVEWEKKQPYGYKASLYELRYQLLAAIDQPGPLTTQELLKRTEPWSNVPLSKMNFDRIVLKESILKKRDDVLLHALEHCGARPGVIIRNDADKKDYQLMDFATKHNVPELTVQAIVRITLGGSDTVSSIQEDDYINIEVDPSTTRTTPAAAEQKKA